MSRAFVKESDDDLTAGELPERPLPLHANYVTPKGLELLQARVRELAERHEELKPQSDDDSEARQKVREIDRDLRYFRSVGGQIPEDPSVTIDGVAKQLSFWRANMALVLRY